MPTRILREGILTSEKVNSLSERAELFYRRLMSVADDYGRYFAHVSILRANCYPLRLNSVSEADVQRMLSECLKSGLVVIYDSGRHLFLPNFGQQTRSRSKFPQPTETELLIKCKSDDKKMCSLVGVGVGVEDVGVFHLNGTKTEPEKAPAWKPDATQLRLNALFKRRETTVWDQDELKQYRRITVNPDDLAAVEAYYRASASGPKDKDYRRRDLATLLNNWNGEVDRARNHKPHKPF